MVKYRKCTLFLYVLRCLFFLYSPLVGEILKVKNRVPVLLPTRLCRQRSTLIYLTLVKGKCLLVESGPVLQFLINSDFQSFWAPEMTCFWRFRPPITYLHITRFLIDNSAGFHNVFMHKVLKNATIMIRLFLS